MRKYDTVRPFVYMRHRRSDFEGLRLAKELLLDTLELVLTGADVYPALRKKLYYARRLGYIETKNGRNTLTVKGRTLLSERQIWDVHIPASRRWDGKWRIVVFDIPIDKHKRRDSFRRRLMELGLQLYQNSVWIYPYPLEKEIGQLADFYRLTGCVSFITAEVISDEYNFIKRFGL